MVPDLGPSSRVVDVGSGTGCLVPRMQRRGVQDILAVDLAEDMLTKVACLLPLISVHLFACNICLGPSLHAAATQHACQKGILRAECSAVGARKH